MDSIHVTHYYYDRLNAHLANDDLDANRAKIADKRDVTIAETRVGLMLLLRFVSLCIFGIVCVVDDVVSVQCRERDSRTGHFWWRHFDKCNVSVYVCVSDTIFFFIVSVVQHERYKIHVFVLFGPIKAACK